MQVWNQISLPTSIAVFFAALNAAYPSGGERPEVLVIGALVSAGLLLYSSSVQIRIDNRVIDLYARIVVLERFLGFEYFSGYLNGVIRKGDNPYREFVNYVRDLSLPTATRDERARFWSTAQGAFLEMYRPRMSSQDSRSIAGGSLARNVFLAAAYLFSAAYINNLL